LSKVRKISDDEFKAYFLENAGIYARTAHYITNEIGIPYTRQAVRQRAMLHPDLIEESRGGMLDIAKSGLRSSMFSKNEAVKLRACLEVMDRLGEEEGWTKNINIQQKQNPYLELDPEERQSLIAAKEAQLNFNRLNE